MKCLHICNDFSSTKVHKNLYTQLDSLGLEQIIFNPVKKNTQVGNNTIDFKSSGSEIIYSSKLKKYHRIFFRDKINHLFKDLNSKYDLAHIDVIHATTLFSDGAVAYQVHKKFKIPYIVAVRGTDVNIFLKYRPDLFFYLIKILQNATKVIFLSKAIEKQFFSKTYIKLTGLEIEKKSLVINNGIDSFWLENVSGFKPKIDPFKILYIGRFDKNKNTLNLIKAVLKLKSIFANVELNLVGKGGNYEKEIISLAKTHKGTVNYFGPIFDKEKLRNIYLSNHIFAMPSYGETFGLVYLEALSQGLPVLCSKNQGIDGTFKFKIGEFTDPNSMHSMVGSLRRLIENYSTYQINQINFTKFNWIKIAETYSNLYQNGICS